MVTITDPPLISFELRIHYPQIKGITFERMAEWEVAIKKKYPKVPEIRLLPSSIKAGLPIGIRPVSYISPDNDKELSLFSDGLVFHFRKYNSWEEIKKDVKREISQLRAIFDVNSFEKFRMEYIDQFSFSREDFKLNNYFNLYHQAPSAWALDYTDFHLGIKFKAKEDESIVIRLRGVPPVQENNFTFRLESVYLKTFKNVSFSSENSVDLLLTYLDDAHAIIIKHFLEILSEATKQKIGVSEDF